MKIACINRKKESIQIKLCAEFTYMYVDKYLKKKQFEQKKLIGLQIYVDNMYN